MRELNFAGARHRSRRRAMAAGVALAMLSFTASALTQHDAQALRAGQSLAAVRAMGPALGLRAGDSITLRSATTMQGRTVLRMEQSYNGHRVWGASALLHQQGSGTPALMQNSLLGNATPAGTPRLSESEAAAIALKAMALKGRALPAKVSLVVFPTKFMGDVKLAWDKQLKKYKLDRKHSVLSVAPAEPFVWAYEVRTSVKNRVDGMLKKIHLVDARTGAILKISEGLQHLAAPNVPTQRDTDVPAKGVGLSQYNGTVMLDTTRHADGTFGLIDRTRGSRYNTFFHEWAVDYDGTPFRDADGNPMTSVGMMTFTDTKEGFGADFRQSTWWYDGNPVNTWGDGKQFVMFPYGLETSANGQTAAVDAHYGMGVSWDFFKNVFKRDGIDNMGTSVFANVHLTSYGEYYDNASWDNDVLGMFYSDGTFNPRPDPATGLVLPGNANGFNSLTSIDIIGHEMGHGITGHTGNMYYEGESGGLNEATSDIFGSMIEAYAKRAPGTDDRIPAGGNNWDIGEQISATPLRNMIKPSDDGYSVNHWYDGIGMIDVHFSSGPLNRWFYFLSQGATSDPAARGYSAYLPSGMNGIGNDAAARIWYKALTEYMHQFADYEYARIAAVAAAADLYGPNSREIAAVRQAFAAINVGNESDETRPRIRVSMPIVHPAGGPLNTWGGSPFARTPIVSMGVSSKASAQVTGTENLAVGWKIGGLSGSRAYGGKIEADGTWFPSNEWGWQAMTVFSVADPLQFAEARMWVVNGDTDGNTEFDAMDVGEVALSWGLTSWVSATHGVVGDGFTDSMDVLAIVEAFRNAFGGA
jgi:Zn-dependent metalloprotease